LRPGRGRAVLAGEVPAERVGVDPARLQLAGAEPDRRGGFAVPQDAAERLPVRGSGARLPVPHRIPGLGSGSLEQASAWFRISGRGSVTVVRMPVGNG